MSQIMAMRRAVLFSFRSALFGRSYAIHARWVAELAIPMEDVIRA